MSTTAHNLEGEALERLQKTLLEMLQVFDTTCKELGLSYWIDSGTCLGAVRHGGLIPWDDDIDVGMMLPDWERFVAEAPAILPEGYSLHTQDNTEGYPIFWACLWKDGTRFIDDDHRQSGCPQAIFMDIFAFVRLDENPETAAKQQRALSLWQGLSYVKSMAHPTGAKGAVRTLAPVAHQFLKLVPQGFLRKRFWKAATTDNPGDQVVNPSYAFHGPFPYDVFMEPAPIDFGGLTVLGPREPVRYLEMNYGDWQQIPPEDKRHTHAPLILDFGDGVNAAE